MTITIMRKIVVKQIVTEEFKKKARAEVQELLKKIEDEMEIFEKEAKKTITEVTLKGHPQALEIKAEIEAEREKRIAYKKQMLNRLKSISKVEIGEEIVQGTIDGPLEVKVGDNFDKLNRVEMVLKDGEIIEIRS